MALIDYRIFGDLLTDYDRLCRKGEVLFSDANGQYTPAELLRSLPDKALRASITGLHSRGNTPTEISIEIPRLLFGKTTRSYSIIWSSERHGWAEANSTGSKTIHYFVLRQAMTDPPHCSDELLVARCKRNWISNCEPFLPDADTGTVCKTCRKRYDDFINQKV